MKIAVIDMGTNTFHLLISEVKDGVFKVLHKERKAVRIGKGGLQDGWITVEAQERALNALVLFKRKADEVGVDKIFATATSAIRNAQNGLELVKMIKDTTDIDVKIISGQEEASFIFGGVKKALSLDKGSFLIMDIGGGSIEFILAKNGESMWMQSFEIGGQRLMDMFHNNDPITPEEIRLVEDYLEDQLAELHEACAVFKPTTLVGSSGTFDTLSDIYRVKNGLEKDPKSAELLINLDSFLSTYQELKSKTYQERLEIPGMIEMRAEMIVVASVLIDFILKRYQLKALRGSAYALKEGVLLSILDSVNEEEKKKKRA